MFWPRFLACAAIAASLGACETPPIDVRFSGTVTVPGCDPVDRACDPLTTLPEIPGVSEFDVSATSAWKGADESPDRVESCEVTSLELAIVSGAGDFRWLDRIAFLVGGDGVEPVTVAELVLDDAARASPRLSLETTGADLAPALRAGPLLVTTVAEGASPPQDTAVRIDGVLAITFGL